MGMGGEIFGGETNLYCRLFIYFIFWHLNLVDLVTFLPNFKLAMLR